MAHYSTRIASSARLLLLLLLAADASAQAPARPASGASNANRGRLVIEGGPATPRHDGIYRAILEGRDGDGPLCIIPTANHDPASAIKEEMAAFGAHGWGQDVVGVPLTADRPESFSLAAVRFARPVCSARMARRLPLSKPFAPAIVRGRWLPAPALARQS